MDRTQSPSKDRFIDFFKGHADEGENLEGAFEPILANLHWILQSQALDPATIFENLFSALGAILGLFLRAALVGPSLPGGRLYQFFQRVKSQLENDPRQLFEGSFSGPIYLCAIIPAVAHYPAHSLFGRRETVVPLIRALDDAKREEFFAMIPELIVASMSQAWYPFGSLAPAPRAPDQREELLKQFGRLLEGLNSERQALDLSEWLLFIVYRVEEHASGILTPITDLRLTCELSQKIFDLVEKLTGISLSESSAEYSSFGFTLRRPPSRFPPLYLCEYEIWKLTRTSPRPDHLLAQGYLDWFSESLDQLESLIDAIRLFNQAGHFGLKVTGFLDWGSFLYLGKWLLQDGNTRDTSDAISVTQCRERYTKLFQRAQSFYLAHHEVLPFTFPKPRLVPKALHHLLVVVHEEEDGEEEEEGEEDDDWDGDTEEDFIVFW